MPCIYKINLSSPPDREKLVAEIMFDHVQWAEIDQESGTLEVEFYPRPDQKPWRINLDTAIEALNSAKGRLNERRF
jgi:hypothetical protein